MKNCDGIVAHGYIKGPLPTGTSKVTAHGFIKGARDFGLTRAIPLDSNERFDKWVTRAAVLEDKEAGIILKMDNPSTKVQSQKQVRCALPIC